MIYEKGCYRKMHAIKQSRQVVENFYLRYIEYLFAWIKVSKRSKDKKINMSGDID